MRGSLQWTWPTSRSIPFSQAFLESRLPAHVVHDHKFDPVSQRDYTAMAGIFLSTKTHYGTVGAVGGRNRSTTIETPKEFRDNEASRTLSAEEYDQLKSRLDELEAKRRELLAQRMEDRRAGKDSPPQPNAVAVQNAIRTGLHDAGELRFKRSSQGASRWVLATNPQPAFRLGRKEDSFAPCNLDAMPPNSNRSLIVRS